MFGLICSPYLCAVRGRSSWLPVYIIFHRSDATALKLSQLLEGGNNSCYAGSEAREVYYKHFQ